MAKKLIIALTCPASIPATQFGGILFLCTDIAEQLGKKNHDVSIFTTDLDFANKADERLSCDYQGDDMQIGFNSRFLSEMLNNLNSNEVLIEMSLPNRAGILTPIDGTDEGEKVTMLVMPVMLNN